MRKLRIAVYSGTDNILPDIITSAKSVICNSAVDEIYVLVDGMDGWNEVSSEEGFPTDILIPKDMHDQTFFSSGGPNMSSPYSHMSLLRAAIPRIFTAMWYDTILSLDYDILAVHDFTEIWDIDVRGYFFAASMEPERSLNGLLYTNTGVALHNLKLERGLGFTDALIFALNHRRYTWVDQDVMNYIGQGRIKEMDATYNSNPWTEPVVDPKIKHFAGWKDQYWNMNPEWNYWREMPWGDVLESNAYLKEVHNHAKSS